MKTIADWDWTVKQKPITDIKEWAKKFQVVHELLASNDGERGDLVCKDSRNT